MNTAYETVRATATCTFCGSENHLTISEIKADQRVDCSTCGGQLGTIGDLVKKTKIRDGNTIEVTGTRPGNFR
jgi:hypothetical protein